MERERESLVETRNALARDWVYPSTPTHTDPQWRVVCANPWLILPSKSHMLRSRAKPRGELLVE